MPSDTRRLAAPETSVSYSEFQQLDATKVFKPKRSDGRKSMEHRLMFIDCGVISQAKGSAYIEMGNTKLIVAIYGPREVQRRKDFSIRGQLNCEFKFATFSCPARREHQQDSEEKQLSALLQQALEPVVCLYKFPKSTVDVYVEVLENDGGCMSAAITACGVALADAGIDMFDLVVGASLRQQDETVLLDPDYAEETVPPPSSGVSYGTQTIGYMPSMLQISTLLQEGDMTPDDISKNIKTLINACQETAQLVKQVLYDKLNSKGIARPPSSS